MKSIYRTPAGRDLVRAWCTERLAEWPIPQQRVTLTANGSETHLVTAGSGGTVLFIPGTNFNAAVSAPIAVALRQAGCQVVIPDVPGQPGLSSDVRVAGARRAAWYGAWLDELVEQVYDDRPVTVVGHSLGAAIALSASSPRISRRVLVSPGGLIRLSLTPAVLLHSTAWFLRPTPARSARLLTTMLAPGHQPPEQLADWMTLVARHTRTSGDPGRLHTTHSTPATTIAVSGSHDVFLPPERLRPAVRDRLHLDLRLVDDAGHLVVHENPAAIAALVA